MPGRPNISNNLTDFPISSETPHEKPAPLEALLDIVSISLKDLINLRLAKVRVN